MWEWWFQQVGWIVPVFLSASVSLLGIQLLFPCERIGWKVATAGATAVALLASAAFLLSAIRVPLDTQPVVIVLAFAGISLMVIATAQRLTRRRKTNTRETSGTDYRWISVSAGAVLVFALATPWAMSAPPAGSTEFFIVESADRLPPWRRAIPIDEPISVTLAVRAQGAVARAFEVHVRVDGVVIEAVSLGTLESVAYTEASVTLPPRDRSPVLYEFFLISPDSSTTPYRTLRFWAVSTQPGA